MYKVSLRGGFSCPNRDGTRGTGGCSYCAGDALQPTGFRPGATIREQLADGARYVAARHGARRVIAYFQDYSATYAPREQLAELYEVAVADPRVVGLAVATRPDCIPDEVLALLADLSRRVDLWLELGLQIADDALLAKYRRGHTVAEFTAAVERAHGLDLRVCAHTIVGLPGADAALERRSAALLAELGLWGVKLHAFHVLRGAPLAAAHAAGALALLSRAEHAARVVDLLERLPAEMIVHRVTAEAPRRLTVAPEWTINKMATFDAVIAELEARDTWQGRLRGAPRPPG